MPIKKVGEGLLEQIDTLIDTINEQAVPDEDELGREELDRKNALRDLLNKTDNELKKLLHLSLKLEGIQDNEHLPLKTLDQLIRDIEEAFGKLNLAYNQLTTIPTSIGHDVKENFTNALNEAIAKLNKTVITATSTRLGLKIPDPQAAPPATETPSAPVLEGAVGLEALLSPTVSHKPCSEVMKEWNSRKRLFMNEGKLIYGKEGFAATWIGDLQDKLNADDISKQHYEFLSLNNVERLLNYLDKLKNANNRALTIQQIAAYKETLIELQTMLQHEKDLAERVNTDWQNSDKSKKLQNTALANALKHVKAVMPETEHKEDLDYLIQTLKEELGLLDEMNDQESKAIENCSAAYLKILLDIKKLQQQKELHAGVQPSEPKGDNGTPSADSKQQSSSIYSNLGEELDGSQYHNLGEELDRSPFNTGSDSEEPPATGKKGAEEADPKLEEIKSVVNNYLNNHMARTGDKDKINTKKNAIEAVLKNITDCNNMPELYRSLRQITSKLGTAGWLGDKVAKRFSKGHQLAEAIQNYVNDRTSDAKLTPPWGKPDNNSKLPGHDSGKKLGTNQPKHRPSPRK